MHGPVRPPVASAEFCMSSFLVLLVISTAEDSRCSIMLRHSRSQLLPCRSIAYLHSGTPPGSAPAKSPHPVIFAARHSELVCEEHLLQDLPGCREDHCAHSGCAGRSPFISDVGKASFFARSAGKPPACLWRVLRKLNECDPCPLSSFRCPILPPFAVCFQCAFSNSGKTLQYVY